MTTLPAAPPEGSLVLQWNPYPSDKASARALKDFRFKPPKDGSYIRLFGGPEVVVRGKTIPLSPYQAALVTAVYGGGTGKISRADLAWLLWEEDDSGPVRQRVRQLLHATNKKAGADIIEARDDLLVANHALLASDERHFRKLIRDDHMREAGELVSMVFGDALDRGPTEEFEDWLEARRVTLGREVRQRASAKWDAGKAATDWEVARDGAEGLYALSPQDVPTIERVIEGRARLGKAALAEAAYATYVDRLDEGLEPDPRLVDLMERVRSLDETGRSIYSGVRRQAPLVGRDEEVAAGRDMVAQVGKGNLRLIVVEGDPGIGKTRLLEEIRKGAKLDGFVCMSAQPVELERRIPLNPIIDALGDIDLRPHLRAIGEPWAAIVGSFMPLSALDGPPAEIPPIQESSLSRRLMDAYWLLFDHIAAQGPTLLFIDDIQWADATTLSVIKFIQRRWEGGALGIVTAVRPDLVDDSDPITAFLGLEDEDHICRIRLGELDAEAARQLVRDVADEEIDDRVADTLCTMAANHPFFLTELTKDFAEGTLTLPRNRHDPIRVPISLRQVLGRRIRGLSPDAETIANRIAIRARACHLAELLETTGFASGRLARALEQLEEARFIEVTNGIVRMSHGLYRSAIYQGMSGSRRALLHREAGFAMEAEHAETAPGELAVHFARGGEAAKAVGYACKAADAAMGRGAVVAAVGYFELALEHERDSVQRRDIGADLAEALHLAGMLERAAVALPDSAAAVRRAGDVARARRLDIRFIECLTQIGATSVEDLLRALEGTTRESLAHQDEVSLALALDAQLQLLHLTEDRRGINDTLDQLRRVAERTTGEACCVASLGLGVGVLFGRTDEAREGSERAVRLATGALRQHRLRALNRLFLVLLYSGEGYTDRGRAVAAEGIREAGSSGDLTRRYSLETNIGVMHLDAGELDLAEEAFDRADRNLAAGRSHLLEVAALFNRGELAIARNEHDLATKLLSAARDKTSSTTPHYLRDLINAGLGLCALEGGSLQRAAHYRAQIRKYAQPWFFDPATILIFESRFLRRQGEVDASLAFLKKNTQLLRETLRLSWMKVELERCLILSRSQAHELQRVALDGAEVAARLKLGTRQRQFEAFLQKAE